MKPTIGRVVLFTLSDSAVERINYQRKNSQGDLRGNPVQAGEIYPMIISRVWPEETYAGGETVNGQVMLDGNDSLWVTSAARADNGFPGTWHWPVIEAPVAVPLKKPSGNSMPLGLP